MRIAVDFDGVIVKNRYPGIGEEIPNAIRILKMLQTNGHHIILWTHRIGGELKAAIHFCRERGLIFFAVNENYPNEIYSECNSRKIRADFYIEGNCLEGRLVWEEVYWFIYLMRYE
jgi:hypothetical protein